MQRYSLYIDHQLVSPLIRQLQAIVKTCCQQLDSEYETYELRTSIYEEFVFQITALYNSKYALKQECKELKDEDLKKYYELTAKLEGINSNVKYEDLYDNITPVKKGRPSKNQQAEDHLIQWVKQKITTEGKLKFSKKEIDQVYLPLVNLDKKAKKKIFPVNFYLRMFRRYDLMVISITARGGKYKSVKDFTDRKNLSESYWMKEEQELDLKDKFKSQSYLESTSEFEDFSGDYDTKQAAQITRSSKIDDDDPFAWRPKTRSCFVENSKKKKKEEKQKQKSNQVQNFFKEDSDLEGINHEWNDLSMQNELFDKIDRKNEIYENSKSFE